MTDFPEVPPLQAEPDDAGTEGEAVPAFYETPSPVATTAPAYLTCQPARVQPVQQPRVYQYQRRWQPFGGRLRFR